MRGTRGRPVDRDVKSGYAAVAGSKLYFERRGSGPPLLLIAGGGGDCGAYTSIGNLLSSSYTVITYDRRGNSRSPLLRSPVKMEIAEQSDDAVAVLRANGFDEALVFGTSGGATIALDIAARHPETAEVVVAHEPPVPRILPDAEEVLAEYDEIERVLDAEGWQEAFMMFLEFNRLTPPDSPVALRAVLEPEGVLPPGPLLDLMKRQASNWEYMLRFEVSSFVDFVPDIRRISQNRTRTVLSAGAGTRGQYFHRTSEVIAERLGAEFVEFPGGHSGAFEVPHEFSAKLRALLDRRERPESG
jgi:pimeloyl-ACP methyl ester carboxylesterase